MGKEKKFSTTCSNSNQVVSILTSPLYFNEVEKDGYIYSIDKIRLSFMTKSNKDMHIIKELIKEHDIAYVDTDSREKYKNRFYFKIMNKGDVRIGLSMNGGKNGEDIRERKLKGYIEYNPNKVSNYLTQVVENDNNSLMYEGNFITYIFMYLLSNRIRYLKIERYDIAVDIPKSKKYIYIEKDNRSYGTYQRNRWIENRSEYLGKRNRPGYFKLYNKLNEMKLEKCVKKDGTIIHYLTRAELTSNELDDFDKFILDFPNIKIVGEQSEYNDELEKDKNFQFVADLWLTSSIDENEKAIRLKGTTRAFKKKLSNMLANKRDEGYVEFNKDAYIELMEYLNRTLREYKAIII